MAHLSNCDVNGHGDGKEDDDDVDEPDKDESELCGICVESGKQISRLGKLAKYIDTTKADIPYEEHTKAAGGLSRIFNRSIVDRIIYLPNGTEEKENEMETINDGT